MKCIIPLLFTLIFLPFAIIYSQVDQYIQLPNNGRISITKESDSWIKVAVPFNILGNPKSDGLRNNRPSTIEEAFNPEYVDDLKVKLSLCFRNEFKKKALRNNSILDSQYYQYYSSEIIYQTIKVDRNTKYANFLFPAALAERDELGGNYLQPVGHIVEISISGAPQSLSNAITFDKYRDDATLLKFKEQAELKAVVNDGVLIPAHHVLNNYFQKDAYIKIIP